MTMAFDTVLRELVERVPGSQASLLMGVDGIPVDTYVPGSALDTQQVGAEYAGVLAAARRAAQSLEAGEVEELTLTTERSVLLVRLVNPDYFVALALVPGGQRGRGRFHLRLASLRLAPELA
jgi:predicted regulator of Ras-like GTPase activity (Roadblock/LC7/MglB family)